MACAELDCPRTDVEYHQAILLRSTPRLRHPDVFKRPLLDAFHIKGSVGQAISMPSTEAGPANG